MGGDIFLSLDDRLVPAGGKRDTESEQRRIPGCLAGLGVVNIFGRPWLHTNCGRPGDHQQKGFPRKVRRYLRVSGFGKRKPAATGVSTPFLFFFLFFNFSFSRLSRSHLAKLLPFRVGLRSGTYVCMGPHRKYLLKYVCLRTYVDDGEAEIYSKLLQTTAWCENPVSVGLICEITCACPVAVNCVGYRGTCLVDSVTRPYVGVHAQLIYHRSFHDPAFFRWCRWLLLGGAFARDVQARDRVRDDARVLRLRVESAGGLFDEGQLD